MSLSVNTLESELLKIIDENDTSFVGWPETVDEAATNWGNAYHEYAQHAVDISEDTLIAANLPGFIASWLAGMAGSTTAAQAATAYENAFISYWTGATFNVLHNPPNGIGGTGVFSAEVTSVVTAITLDVMANLLEAEFGVSSDDAATKAAALATAMHTATTTAVLVLITGLDTTAPPTGPLPIINTSPIH